MSQKDKILEYMKAGNRINKIKAIDLFGCYVLSQRAKNIKDEIDRGLIKGYKFHVRLVKEHKNAAEYWLSPIDKQLSLL